MTTPPADPKIDWMFNLAMHHLERGCEYSQVSSIIWCSNDDLKCDPAAVRALLRRALVFHVYFDDFLTRGSQFFDANPECRIAKLRLPSGAGTFYWSRDNARFSYVYEGESWVCGLDDLTAAEGHA